MKRGQKTTIRIIDSASDDTYKTIEAFYLGSGMFSKCYYTNDGRVYSYTSDKRTDYSKEAISGISQNHLPDITKEGFYEFNNRGRIESGILYSMPLYNKLTKDNREAWEQARILQHAKDECFNSDYKKRGYQINYAIIESVRGTLPDELIEALELINDNCMNYDDNYLFEFNNANLAVDNNERLILLDVIFCRDSVHRR